MLKSGIRTRLIASFLLLIGIALLLLGGYILWFFHRYNIEQLSRDLLVEAKIAEQFLHPYLFMPNHNAIDAVTKELSGKVDRRITIIDAAGVVLADSQANPASMENHSKRPEVLAAMTGGEGRAIHYSNTLSENMLYVAIPIRSGAEITGVVRIASSLAYVENGFAQLSSALLLALLATSVLTILFGIRLARKYTEPLEKMTAVAKLMSKGHLESRIHLHTGDEIETLAQTLNNLAAGLDEKISEILAEKRKLELILNNMDNGVILLDRYRRVTDVNKQAASAFGISGKMLGLHNIEVIGYSVLDKALQETIEQGHSRHINLKTNFSGIQRIFQVFLAPTFSGDNEITGVLGVFHDITALKEIEERQADFVANASHELGTPLTAIKGFAETLLDGALQDEQLSAKFVAIIHKEAERMHRIVQDLLQLAKLNSHHRPIVLEPIAVKNAVQSVIDQLYPHWRAKSLAIRLDCAETHKVLANRDWLVQILVNLLSNAIKYTADEGNITIRCEQMDDRIKIDIKDSGVGIPAADLPFIFDRFYRVDRSRGRQGGGTGLGLAIAKFLTENLNGRIEVKSAVGLGTTFSVILPLAKEPENPI